jgi:hypothetical protein
MDPCPKFQGLAICAPGTGIVPCAGVDYPKMGVLLPNVSFQTNGDEPTGIVCAGVP